MKTLIINGSPRKNGDTAYLLSVLKENLSHEFLEIRVYDGKISPCIDCQMCKVKKGCAIDDGMNLIYGDDFDNAVIASPLYMSNLTGPLVSFASRFQAYYCAKRFLKDEFILRKKKSALILTGGDGGPERAISMAQWVFKNLNAPGF